MDRGKTITPNGVVVANHYLIGLSVEDIERFSHFSDALRSELVKGLQDEVTENGWKTLGPIQVEFESQPKLKIGRYMIETRILEGEFQNEPPAAAAASIPPVAPIPTAAAPAPPVANQPNPRVITADGQEIALASYTVKIGRLDDCNVIFDDPNVSRHHSEIRPVGDTFEIADLGSTNGTYVNGTRIPGAMTLRDGDRISVGRNTLIFRV